MTSWDKIGDWHNVSAQVLGLVRSAGEAILAIVAESSALDVQLKSDHTPVTRADQAAHQILWDGLSSLTPSISVISEEDECSHALLGQQDCFWLIDPLDGTRELLAGRAEYTVNVALVHAGLVRYGWVGVPMTQCVYHGGSGSGAWRVDMDHVEQILQVAPWPCQSPRVVISVSHQDAETERWLAALGAYTKVPVGSSLKFCHVAQGTADLYPRMQRLCAWDIAAGQAVLEGAGGAVLDLQGQALTYSNSDICMPYFIAASIPWPKLSR